VAKVTSLRQAAKIGGGDLGELINRLRSEAGIVEVFRQEPEESSQAERPEWWRQEKIVERLDIRPLLEKGEKPIGRVMKELGDLQGPDVYELTAAFLPAPLVDMAQAKGFDSWCLQEESDLFRIYFHRKGA
jgi:hypothetical protein